MTLAEAGASLELYLAVMIITFSWVLIICNCVEATVWRKLANISSESMTQIALQQESLTERCPASCTDEGGNRLNGFLQVPGWWFFCEQCRWAAPSECRRTHQSSIHTCSCLFIRWQVTCLILCRVIEQHNNSDWALSPKAIKSPVLVLVAHIALCSHLCGSDQSDQSDRKVGLSSSRHFHLSLPSESRSAPNWLSPWSHRCSFA